MRRGAVDEKMQQRGYLTVQQVAAMTGYSEPTVRAAIAAGRLAVERVGARVFTTKQAVVRYLGRGAAAALGIT